MTWFSNCVSLSAIEMSLRNLDSMMQNTYFSLCQVPAFHVAVDVPYQCLLTVQLLTDKCGVLVIKITALFTFPFFLSQWIKHGCYNLLSKAFFYFSWVLFKCIVLFLILTTSILEILICWNIWNRYNFYLLQIKLSIKLYWRPIHNLLFVVGNTSVKFTHILILHLGKNTLRQLKWLS